MFNQRRESHLKVTPFRSTDVNRESHLKHPAAGVNTIRQYRQSLNVKRNASALSWAERLITWLKF